MVVTLKDETGQVNVIIWPSLLEKQRREALGPSPLAVNGPSGRTTKAATESKRIATDKTESTLAGLMTSGGPN